MLIPIVAFAIGINLSDQLVKHLITMVLGQQLVTQLLPEEINKTGIKHVKGCFTNERNYTIACRFYYHFSIKGLRYERCLTELNKEFHLSEIRIAQLIMLCRDHLEKLKNGKATKKSLATELPYYNWN